MRGWPRVGCCYLANIVRQPIHPWTTTNAEFSLVSSDISTDSGNTVFEQICFFPRTMWNFRIQFLVTVNRFEMFFWLDKSVWLYKMYKMCWKFLCVLPTFVTISRLARISSQMIFLRRLSRSHKSLLNICHQMDGHAIEPCIKFNHWKFPEENGSKRKSNLKMWNFPPQLWTNINNIWPNLTSFWVSISSEKFPRQIESKHSSSKLLSQSVLYKEFKCTVNIPFIPHLSQLLISFHIYMIVLFSKCSHIHLYMSVGFWYHQTQSDNHTPSPSISSFLVAEIKIQNFVLCRQTFWLSSQKQQNGEWGFNWSESKF